MKQKIKTNEDFDNFDSSWIDDESEDGQSSTSHKDQDNDVSFESDADEEIDTSEIEEEDWVDYIKSTNDAIEKMWNERIRCWKLTQKKNEMETGDENRNITEREMVDQSSGMEPRIQLKIQDQQIDWKTKEKMERWHQRIPQTCGGRDRKPDRKQQPYQ